MNNPEHQKLENIVSLLKANIISNQSDEFLRGFVSSIEYIYPDSYLAKFNSKFILECGSGQPTYKDSLLTFIGDQYE